MAIEISVSAWHGVQETATTSPPFPSIQRETASVCESARGWGGIFMPLKRLTSLLNSYINLLSRVMTLCWPWPAEQPSSEVQNMKVGEGRSRGGGKLGSPWLRLPKAFRQTRNKSCCARAIPTQALTHWEGFPWGAFQSQLQPHTTFQLWASFSCHALVKQSKAAESTQTAAFRSLVPVLLCPVCTSAAGSSSHLNFQNSGEGKTLLFKDASSFVAFWSLE